MNGKIHETEGGQRVHPMKFNSKEEAENYIKLNKIENVVSMSVIQWRNEIQPRISMRPRKDKIFVESNDNC